MSTHRVPKLPPTDAGEANSLRYEVNPAIALNALTDIYQHVQQYQVQLRQLVHRIQRIYAEGPVVSGWLASAASLNAAVKYSNHAGDMQRERSSEASGHPSHQSPSLESMDVALFRHGDADDLMNYLSALESTMLESGSSDEPLSNGQASTPDHHAEGDSSQYYLCQLDSCGQIHAEQCPPEQVPVLSMAIARYRRLNQLIKQKQAIETKLQAIVDVLGDVQRLLAE